MPFLLTFLAGMAAALLLLALVLRTASFRAQRPEDYAGEGPAFDLARDVNGPLDCEGVIYGPFGRVAARFVARMQADWDGNRGTMTEAFRYHDGSSQHRVWTLTVGEDGAVLAEAPDVLGTGRGRQSGPALCLHYRLRLPETSGGHVLNVTDWMYVMENGSIVNRSQFRKFGIKVAELVAVMRPAEAREALGKTA
ncbi:DUF3833 domain-containing protein [Mangrovicoccus sp. HB161399]|uniref:DUF3833 domain-containing protein n=1 Tax=Mangrovicoccus sp. HB161399 TaxID=2720392 RepID=UPI0015527354|nr:DUF3833 domain-containing protein [Mangrovicoccus sp. HB161399]